MKEAFVKLLKVKSIVTLGMMALVIYMGVTGSISGSEILAIFTVIINFFFNYQANKKNEESGGVE